MGEETGGCDCVMRARLCSSLGWGWQVALGDLGGGRLQGQLQLRSAVQGSVVVVRRAAEAGGVIGPHSLHISDLSVNVLDLCKGCCSQLR